MIKIGIICPSEIAFRRFMPALKKLEEKIMFAGIGYATPTEWFGDVNKISEDIVTEQQEREHIKAQTFINEYGGKIYDGYQKLIESTDIDAIYLPLPPALHYRWAKMALEHGKHVLVEKPSTTSLIDTQTLINIAKSQGLALHENYMFMFHKQIEDIMEVISSGEIGEIRLFRISFGFPRRQQNDFRYNKALGGGALLDAGGYTFKLANYLLGGDAHIVAAQSNKVDGFEVDMYGSAMLVNNEGVTAQVAFGMDNDYKCELEIWGSKGTISTGRILTAPSGFVPEYIIKKNQETEKRLLSSDDAFCKSISRFVDCVTTPNVRNSNYNLLLKQESLLSEFINLI